MINDIEKSRQEAWECGLPPYLQHDLDAYKEGVRTNSTLLDCLWSELYGSINGANGKKIDRYVFHLCDVTFTKRTCHVAVDCSSYIRTSKQYAF